MPRYEEERAMPKENEEKPSPPEGGGQPPANAEGKPPPEGGGQSGEPEVVLPADPGNYGPDGF